MMRTKNRDSAEKRATDKARVQCHAHSSSIPVFRKTTRRKNALHQITIMKNRGMLISPTSPDAFEFVRRVMKRTVDFQQTTDRAKSTSLSMRPCDEQIQPEGLAKSA
jgi:hypothetical protein